MRRMKGKDTRTQRDDEKKNTNEVRKRPASEQCRAHLIKLTHFQLLHFLGCAMQFIIILQLYYCRCRFHKRCCCCCCRCRSNLHCRRFSLFTRCFQLLFFSSIPKKNDFLSVPSTFKVFINKVHRKVLTLIVLQQIRNGFSISIDVFNSETLQWNTQKYKAHRENGIFHRKNRHRIIFNRK